MRASRFAHFERRDKGKRASYSASPFQQFGHPEKRIGSVVPLTLKPNDRQPKAISVIAERPFAFARSEEGTNAKTASAITNCVAL
jgi:hypothetical protein